MQNTTTAIRQDSTTGTLDEIIDRLGPSPVVLAVWAHPDDESFLAGGLISALTRRGGRVVNVAATSGEHGTPDPEVDPPSILGPRRVRELDAALGVLGVRSRIHLGFGDGACDRVPLRSGATAVGSTIDRVDPDLVLTFGRDGVTGHPDHRSIGRWTRRAVARRGDRIPVLATAAGAAWPTHCVERLHTVNAFWPGYPDRITSPLDVIVELEDELVDRKLDALACHESQMGPVATALGPDGFRSLASVEAYRPANRLARDLVAPGPVSHRSLPRLEPAMS